MEQDRTTKKVFNTQPIGTRREGRQDLRWIDSLEKDLSVLRNKSCRTLAKAKGLLGKRLLEKAKIHPILSSH
ncbi:hypothetical protein TNCV_2628771 [Trichonephila clavipes]|uniref:Uncharacterized protein n=1 Tax=Trichonephila clavipes TaxID=2585209 RepID=A0A8X6SEW8_TRICX|nr:hypothetical protein TNCV_2628771 [Trichonephila clavipes]